MAVSCRLLGRSRNFTIYKYNIIHHTVKVHSNMAANQVLVVCIYLELETPSSLVTSKHKQTNSIYHENQSWIPTLSMVHSNPTCYILEILIWRYIRSFQFDIKQRNQNDGRIWMNHTIVLWQFSQTYFLCPGQALPGCDGGSRQPCSRCLPWWGCWWSCPSRTEADLGKQIRGQ